MPPPNSHRPLQDFSCPLLSADRQTDMPNSCAEQPSPPQRPPDCACTSFSWRFGHVVRGTTQAKTLQKELVAGAVSTGVPQCSCWQGYDLEKAVCYRFGNIYPRISVTKEPSFPTSHCFSEIFLCTTPEHIFIMNALKVPHLTSNSLFFVTWSFSVSRNPDFQSKKPMQDITYYD